MNGGGVNACKIYRGMHHYTRKRSKYSVFVSGIERLYDYEIIVQMHDLRLKETMKSLSIMWCCQKPPGRIIDKQKKKIQMKTVRAR